MDSIMVYKITHGLDGSPFNMFLCTMTYQQDLVVIGYSRSFVIWISESIVFSQRVDNDWNSLLIEVVQVSDVKTKLGINLDLTIYNWIASYYIVIWFYKTCLIFNQNWS